MSFNWNNVKPACCARWLVLPSVYSDALSYGEQLDKFCYQLNQLIENNNILPDFIAEMIKEYINSGAIGEVVRDILADYILNVKYPPEGIKPAVGDGSADDTEAIQGCIDYASANGGVVYFPYGSYLTQPLTMKDGVSLFGFDRYSTKIVLKGGATKPLISGTVAELSIANLTLDGNSGIQVNDVNVVAVMATDMLMTNLIIKDGYTLVNYYGTGGHFQISDVVFGNAVEKCLLTAGNANVQAESLVFNQLSAVGGICVLDIGTDGGYFNVKSVATCDKCIVVSGNENNVVAIVENATTPVTDDGLKNNIEIVGISDKQYFDGDTSKEVNGSYSKHVGGTYTKAVDGNGSESYDGTYAKIVTGVSSETYNGDRTITEENETKTVKKKVVNANDIEITASNGYKSSAPVHEFDGNDIKLLCENPLTYKTPSALNRYFKSIPMKDNNGGDYSVLVYNDVNLQHYNVKDYGAKGDGVTDDTSSIQSCFDSAMVDGGGLVIFPSGTYLVSDTLIIRPHTASINDGNPQSIHFISMDRLQIIGEGQATIKATAEMDYMLRTYDFSYPANVGSFSNFYTHISGLKLDGNEMATNGIFVYQALHSIIEYNQIFDVINGINIYGYGELDVRNNVIKCSGKGIVMTSGGDTLIEKNDIFLDDNAVGIDMTAFSGSTLINKNTFTPTYATVESHKGMNNTIGVNIYNGNWNDAPATTGPVHISNNSFDGVLWGVKAYSSVAHKVCDIEVFHNKLANNGYYTGINLFSGQNVENCMIHNNNGGVNYDYAGAIGKLVELTESTGCTIANNLVCASQDSPIKLYNSNANTVIGNTLLNPSLNSTTGAGIVLQGTSINNVVKGNVVRQNGSGANITHIGIAEQGSCNYNIASDNEFFGEITERYQSVGANSYFHYTGYGYNAPTSGTWKKGDVVYNEEPYADEQTFCWVCVTSGTPGTWGKVKWTS